MLGFRHSVMSSVRPSLPHYAPTARVYPSVPASTQSGGGEVNFHFNPVTHGLDAESLDRVLSDHGRVFARHFEKWARRENAVSIAGGACAAVTVAW